MLPPRFCGLSFCVDTSSRPIFDNVLCLSSVDYEAHHIWHRFAVNLKSAYLHAKVGVV